MGGVAISLATSLEWTQVGGPSPPFDTRAGDSVVRFLPEAEGLHPGRHNETDSNREYREDHDVAEGAVVVDPRRQHPSAEPKRSSGADEKADHLHRAGAQLVPVPRPDQTKSGWG